MEIFLALGSNIGDRLENIKNAIHYLEEKITILKVSTIIETEPYGVLDQPKFLNCVLKGNTNLKPQELLSFVLGIEEKMGRKRTIKWGPRNIDIDILFYESLIIENENLKIPHPELHKRAFVLIPLCEIAPDFIHPVFNKTMMNLKNELTKS